MNLTSDFRKYATRHLGMNGMALDDVMAAQNQYLNPYILEERQLNVTQMDVFSRLMMDRIIFLGTEINDYTANTIQAQLLYLDSTDPGKDISIYINSPGGSVTAGLGIYDTYIAQYKLVYSVLPNIVHAPAWLHQWVQCCSLQDRRVSALHCHTAA